MRRWLMIGVVLVAVGIVGSADAMFRAADLVVIPAASSQLGLTNSAWHTDLEIRNVDETPIDVEIVFLPTGGGSNYTWYRDIANHLGGRSEDGFGHVDDRLKDIQPGAAVTLTDVVKANWGEGRTGGLLLFAYEAGTLTTTVPPGGTPRKIVATSRTYSVSQIAGATEGETIDVTVGQAIPGLPWYDYIDPNQVDKGLDHVTFTGIREDTDYRTNVGFINVSDPLTEVDLEVKLTAADGTELGVVHPRLRQLSHVQYDQAVRNLFGLNTTDYPSVQDATLTVTIKGWISTAQTPTPALIVYASRVDNHSNDPVYLEQTFDVELPWDCVFNGNCTAAATAKAMGSLILRRQPLHAPARW